MTKGKKFKSTVRAKQEKVGGTYSERRHEVAWERAKLKIEEACLARRRASRVEMDVRELAAETPELTMTSEDKAVLDALQKCGRWAVFLQWLYYFGILSNEDPRALWDELAELTPDTDDALFTLLEKDDLKPIWDGVEKAKAKGIDVVGALRRGHL